MLRSSKTRSVGSGSGKAPSPKACPRSISRISCLHVTRTRLAGLLGRLLRLEKRYIFGMPLSSTSMLLLINLYNVNPYCEWLCGRVTDPVWKNGYREARKTALEEGLDFERNHPLYNIVWDSYEYASELAKWPKWCAR